MAFSCRDPVLRMTDGKHECENYHYEPYVHLYSVNSSDLMRISIKQIFGQQLATFEASTIAASACNNCRSSGPLWSAQRRSNWKIWQMSESGKNKIEQQPLTPTAHLKWWHGLPRQLKKRLCSTHSQSVCVGAPTRVMNHPCSAPPWTLLRRDSGKKTVDKGSWWCLPSSPHLGEIESLLFSFNIISVWREFFSFPFFFLFLQKSRTYKAIPSHSHQFWFQ